MAEEGISLENIQQMESQVRDEYELRYARGAHKMLSKHAPDEIKDSIRKWSNEFQGKSILSTLQDLSLFARNNDNPEALLKVIEDRAGNFVKDIPDEYNDGIWQDARKAREIASNAPWSNIAYLLWEKTAEKYKEMHGDIPETEEEKKQFEEAKQRAKTTKVI